MIVKNEEKYLPECLESVKDIVDEIVVVDTGSSDRTIEIAKEYGAKIFHFDWINDFSAARNFALRNSSGDWILYLDADERLESNSINELKKISQSKNKCAYFCTVKSLDRIEGRDNSMRYIRLFPNDSRVEFRGKVHEQITYSLTENNYKIFQSSVSILHVGYNVTKEEKKKKAERNLILLLQEYSKSKTAYFAYQLANTYNVLEDYDSAKEYFLISANSNSFAKNLRADCFCSLALIHHKSHELILAEKYLSESISLNENQPFTFLLGAKIFLLGNKLSKAEEYCRKAFELSKKSPQLLLQSEVLSRVDLEEVIYFGISVALFNKNIQSIQFYVGHLIEAFKRDCPDNFSLRISVMQKLFDGKDMNILEKECFEEMINEHNLNLFTSLVVRNTDVYYKYNLFLKLHERFVDNSDIIKMLATTLDEVGKPSEAIDLLEQYKKEDDPGMMLYLLSFYVKTGNEKKIKETFSILSNSKTILPEIKQKLELIKSKLPAELFRTS